MIVMLNAEAILIIVPRFGVSDFPLSSENAIDR